MHRTSHYKYLGEDSDEQDVTGQADELIEVGAGRRSDALLGAGVEPATVRRNAVFRLQARLGKEEQGGHVSAREVYRSITSLGLVKYSISDLERLLERLNEVSFEREDGPASLSRAAAKLRGVGSTRRSWSMAVMYKSEEEEKLAYPPSTLPMRVLTELLLDDDSLAHLEAEFQEMCLTIREVLFSGDANRLVAELTNVCVDDVAAPMEKADFITMMEPFVAFAIILNGVFIGVQSSIPEGSGIDAWFWTNVGFTCFFAIEIGLRAAYVGAREFISGQDRSWNMFDLVLISVSLSDVIVEATLASTTVAPLMVVRIMRLTRLPRLIRIFRLRQMRELKLMVRGLLGGFKTLFWAVILLFFTIYMVACLLTATVGRGLDPAPDIVSDDLLSSVPKSFVTCFRCFMGDCNTSRGKPIVKLLVDWYGPPFALAYGAVMIFVMLGLFNLIIAVYIENTLSAAKTEGEKSKAQRHRESVRVARLTRQLLKKFCALEKLWSDTHNGDASEIKQVMSQSDFADIGGFSVRVSKEMFLCLIQDRSVHELMDELDIPSERAALFDILDSDGSGDLEVVELITGLLRVRGEAKKSDVLGTLLAVRSIQDMLRAQEDRIEAFDKRLERHMRSQTPSLSRSAPFRGSRWSQWAA